MTDHRCNIGGCVTSQRLTNEQADAIGSALFDASEEVGASEIMDLVHDLRWARHGLGDAERMREALQRIANLGKPGWIRHRRQATLDDLIGIAEDALMAVNTSSPSSNSGLAKGDV